MSSARMDAIVQRTSVALSTLPEEYQIKVFEKYADSLDDGKLKNRIAIKFLEIIEGKEKLRKAERWMETYYRNRPGARPMLVANEYMLVTKTGFWKERLYKHLSRKVYNRLKKREERANANGRGPRDVVVLE